MKAFRFAMVLTVTAWAVPASAQDATITYGTIEYGETLPETDTFGTITYGETEPETPTYGVIEYGETAPATPFLVSLEPGEEIVDTYVAPPVIQTVPVTPTQPAFPAQIVVTGTLPPGAVSVAPAVDIDRVTGLPRNTAGWSGKTAGPAGIGCFPKGACEHLNR